MSVRKARVPIFRPKGRLNCLASPPTATLSTALNTAYAVASMGFVGSGMNQCDWGAVQLLGQKVLTTVPCKDGQRAPDLPFGAATGTGAQPGPTWPTTPTPGVEYTSFAFTARLIGVGTDASIAFSECTGQRPDGIDNLL